MDIIGILMELAITFGRFLAMKSGSGINGIYHLIYKGDELFDVFSSQNLSHHAPGVYREICLKEDDFTIFLSTQSVLKLQLG